MRARPVVTRFRCFHRRSPLPPGPAQGAGGVYALDIGAWLHAISIAELLRE